MPSTADCLHPAPCCALGLLPASRSPSGPRRRRAASGAPPPPSCPAATTRGCASTPAPRRRRPCRPRLGVSVLGRPALSVRRLLGIRRRQHCSTDWHEQPRAVAETPLLLCFAWRPPGALPCLTCLTTASPQHVRSLESPLVTCEPNRVALKLLNTHRV